MTGPRGTCPDCGCPITGRGTGVRQVILRRHLKARAGTRESGYGPAIACRGSGKTVDVLTEDDDG